MIPVNGSGWLCMVTLAALCLASGCGAIFNGTSSSIPVTSNPSGAEVWVDGELVGRTPTQIRVSNDEDHAITFRIAGGEDQTVQVRRRMQAGYVVLDLFFAFPLGLVVDAATGSWYAPDRDRVHAEIRQARPAWAQAQQGYGPPGPAQQYYGPQGAPQQAPPQPQYGPPAYNGQPTQPYPTQGWLPPQGGPPSQAPVTPPPGPQPTFYAGQTATW